MSTSFCYIRHRGKNWTHALDHHRRGLEIYISFQRNLRTSTSEPMLICTNSPDGSVFMAYYSKKNPAIYTFREWSEDVQNETDIDIMLCSVSLPIDRK